MLETPACQSKSPLNQLLFFDIALKHRSHLKTGISARLLKETLEVIDLEFESLFNYVKDIFISVLYVD